MTEKLTDHYMITEYNKIFKHFYHTEKNKKLFKSLQPDGWDIIDNKYLIIIEDKKQHSYKKQGKKQLIKYYENIDKETLKEFKNVFLILGYGIDIETFAYYIYEYNSELINLNITLQELYNKFKIKNEFDIKHIHELNKYMYDNGINLSKSQKTLFIASILICLKIDNNFIDDYNESSNSYNIASKMLNNIDEYYNDKTFTHIFEFITKSVHNKYLFHIFNVIKSYILEYGNDILNLFYSEFCLWDRNNDAALGVVLTPDDIIKLMVAELNIKEDEIILDFCTGTGSFLIECSKYSKYVYGCENNDERYSLAKCNYILRDLNYDNLIYNSCFNIRYKSSSFDKIIINPPFGSKCNNPDELNKNNSLNWKSFKKEQKFVIYGLELLKENGIGCFIIPRSNFNDNNKNKEFKETILKTCKILKIYSLNSAVFVPNASVECSILVVKKMTKEERATGIKGEQLVNIIDYTDDGYIINKKLRIKEHDPNIETQQRILNKNNNWNFEKDDNELINLDMLINKYNNDYTHYYNDRLITRNKFKKLKTYIKISAEDLVGFRFNISELLKPIDKIKRTIIKNTKTGKYPLISSTQYNNGVIKYIDEYNYDTFGDNVISISRNGSVGYCFVQKNELSITTDIILCELLTDINPHLLALLLTIKLTKMFGYSNKITWERIKDIEILLH